jgi:hypothetical protein
MILMKGRYDMGFIRFILVAVIFRRVKWLGLALAGFGLARRFLAGRGEASSTR